MSGLIVMALGVWGALIPFVGPYFHYAFGGFQAWHFTMQRLWLDIVPGAVAVIGGFMLLTSNRRMSGLLGGWLAVAAGAWFAIGPVVSLLWHHTIYAIGAPAGGYARQMLEWGGYFFGLGVLIVGFAAFAMGRYFSRPRIAEEAGVLAADAAAEASARHRPTTRAAVADRPAERAAVADRPTERAAVADRPLERDAMADRPTERAAVADRPLERDAMTDPPAERATMADAPTTRNTVADAPADRTAVSDAPAYTAPGAQPVRTGRRSGGLLGRFRRS